MSADFAAATIEWGTTPDTITLLELLKQFMGITDSARDTELSMYLQMGGELAEKHIDNKIARQEVIEQFTHKVSPVALRYWPVDTLTTIVIDGTDETADWDVFVQDGLYWAKNGDTSCTLEQVDITYDCGYDPLPTELGYAIAQIAQAYEENAGSTGGAVKRESIVGVGSIEYVTAADAEGNTGMLSPSVIGALERYRRYHA